ncbi:MAG: outer membrane protein assembly factor BamD [Nitrospiraceae bacterium]|nr:MAG: outer membrane protein assembly factor BamD [Nitrospiraceae bacterium]
MKFLKKLFPSIKIFLYFTIPFLVFACSSAKKEVKETPFEPEKTLLQAESLMERGFYEDARKVLEEIRTKDASLQYSILAKLRIADTYFDDGSYEEAVVEYESFLSAYPSHKYASYAQYKLAMSFFRQITTVDVSYSAAQRAMQEFEKLQRTYPRNPYMEVTESRIAACRRILAEYEFYVGSFYFKKGAYGAAAQRFDGLLKNFPDSVKESETLYYLGLSYENMGQREKAVNTLTALIEKFPAIKLSSDAKELISSLKEKK